MLEFCDLAVCQTEAHCFLAIAKQLCDPDERGQEAGPGVGAAHGKQRALADLVGVPQPLEEGWHIVLYLAKGLGIQVGVHLPKVASQDEQSNLLW